MKKIIIIVLALAASSLSAMAQDVITKKDGTDVKVKVREISDDAIKYHRWDNLEGPIYVIKKSDIYMIRFENGSVEIMDSTPVSDGEDSSYAPQKASSATQRYPANSSPYVSGEYYALHPEYLAEGLNYRRIKSNYDKRDYSKLADPKYSPGLAWLNLVLPGLAQFSMGESGQGWKYLGLGVGSGLMGSVGYALGVSGEADGLAIVLFFVGTIGGLVNEIASMTNASKMAKIKSLYYDDMTHWPGASRSYGFNISFEPTLQTSMSPQGYCIAPGVGMRVTF